MNSLQCLMGGNMVQFQGSPAVSNVMDNKDLVSKKTKTKKKKTVKKKKDGKVIKVFKPDGEINLYHKPIMVSEVMTDEYMVCRSDSFYIGQKIPPLSQHDRLQPGHTYFLLPVHLFHSVLSFVTIASFTSSSLSSSSSKEHEDVNSNMKMKAAFLKKAAASSCSPFDIQKTPLGTLRIRVSELFLSQLIMDKQASTRQGQELIGDSQPSADHLLCTTPQLHKEYTQLVVGSRRGWKPKLEMIKETPIKGKRKVKMLLSASINRMKRKMKKNRTSSTSTSSSSSSSSSSHSLKKRIKKVKTKKSVKHSVALKANKLSETT
ncbi:hypothetical protein QVD17_25502 [Tagetes erecta]|uniref:Uncharacterized protein n=1 Tax=Tagetes erecta TaxID=13708 RepID=A0AAD8KGE1_TARER|nr:hypothetical protein QVD17_25502 [Tagetes erecta]